MKKKKSIHFIIGALFFLLIISSFVIYSNLHYHIYNGFIIVHGHPYNKTQNDNSTLPPHLHSPGDFFYYFSVVSLEFLICLIASILFFIKFVKYLINHLDQFLYNNPFFSNPSLRVPPMA